MPGEPGLTISRDLTEPVLLRLPGEFQGHVGGFPGERGLHLCEFGERAHHRDHRVEVGAIAHQWGAAQGFDPRGHRHRSGNPEIRGHVQHLDVGAEGTLRGQRRLDARIGAGLDIDGRPQAPRMPPERHTVPFDKFQQSLEQGFFEGVPGCSPVRAAPRVSLGRAGPPQPHQCRRQPVCLAGHHVSHRTPVVLRLHVERQGHAVEPGRRGVLDAQRQQLLGTQQLGLAEQLDVVGMDRTRQIRHHRPAVRLIASGAHRVTLQRLGEGSCASRGQCRPLAAGTCAQPRLQHHEIVDRRHVHACGVRTHPGITGLPHLGHDAHHVTDQMPVLLPGHVGIHHAQPTCGLHRIAFVSRRRSVQMRHLHRRPVGVTPRTCRDRHQSLRRHRSRGGIDHEDLRGTEISRTCGNRRDQTCGHRDRLSMGDGRGRRPVQPGA